MLRRTFLRSIAEICGLVTLPAPALSRAALRTVRLQTSPVAGFQYHAGDSVWPMLRMSDSVLLVREPHNPFDPEAVRVEWESHTLGYVPRAQNHAVAQLLDRNETLTAHITALTNSTDPWQPGAIRGIAFNENKNLLAPAEN